MKQFATLVLAFAALSAGAQTLTFTQVRHIHTALNHLTVLDLGESITTFAVADPNAYSVERHGNQVFLEPTRAASATNLFIWTKTRELSYELDAAGAPEQMDVLIRSLPPAATPAEATQAAAQSPSDATVQKLAGMVMTQVLAGSRDITRDTDPTQDGQVGVRLDQVYRAKNATYLRYTLVNRTKEPFRVTPPSVKLMFLSQEPVALPGLRNHQLTEAMFERFATRPGNDPVVVDSAASRQDVAPGASVTGVVGFRDSDSNPPQIFSLDFGSEQAGPVTAKAVL